MRRQAGTFTWSPGDIFVGQGTPVPALPPLRVGKEKENEKENATLRSVADPFDCEKKQRNKKWSSEVVSFSRKKG